MRRSFVLVKLRRCFHFFVMNTSPISRRNFLRTTTAATVAAAVLPELTAAEKSRPAGPSWPIGCFNRPWTKWTYDETLKGIKDAGYNLTGLLTMPKGETFTAATSTPEYLTNLKQRIKTHGLSVNMTAIRFKAADPLEDMIKDLHQQIENASRLELQYMLTFGVDKPEHYNNFYRLMADASAQAEKRGIQIVLKPHGGGSGASEEILRCIDKVAHANFKVWYDAGNIIFYTGKDPLAELEPVAKYVTGFCAKDCPQPRGEVMSQFGTGKVDFLAVFKKLKSVGFNGPIMVEGVKVGATAEETTANAKANREFLEKMLAAV
jgi:sugar phosphate isomerase/epimerase